MAYYSMVYFTQIKIQLSKLEMGQQQHSNYFPQNNDLSEALVIHLQLKSCLIQTDCYIRTSDGKH